MVRKGDIIEHPVTGERSTFLETSQDTSGEYSRYEVRVSPHGFVAAPHIHPLVEETFEILSGTWAFVVDGKERQLGYSMPRPYPYAQRPGARDARAEVGT